MLGCCPLQEGPVAPTASHPCPTPPTNEEDEADWGVTPAGLPASPFLPPSPSSSWEAAAAASAPATTPRYLCYVFISAH